MTWQELADLIYAEAMREKVQRPQNLPDDPEILLSVLLKHQQRVDDLCDHWSLTGEWQLMLPEEWWMIQFRLLHGWELAIRLAQPNALGETLPVPVRPAALRWLIADSWTQVDTQALAIPPASDAWSQLFVHRPPSFPS